MEIGRKKGIHIVEIFFKVIKNGFFNYKMHQTDNFKRKGIILTKKNAE